MSEAGAEAGRTPCPKGSGQEELPYVRGQGQWPRVQGCDSAGRAERSHPTSKARGGGQEEPPCFRGQGQQPGGATPHPRPGAVAGRSHTTSEDWWLHGHRRA